MPRWKIKLSRNFGAGETAVWCKVVGKGLRKNVASRQRGDEWAKGITSSETCLRLLGSVTGHWKDCVSGSKAKAFISSGLFFKKQCCCPLSTVHVWVCVFLCLSICESVPFSWADPCGPPWASLTAPRAWGPTLLVFMETWQLSLHPPFALQPHSNGFICVPWSWARAGPGTGCHGDLLLLPDRTSQGCCPWAWNSSGLLSAAAGEAEIRNLTCSAFQLTQTEPWVRMTSGGSFSRAP